MLSSCDRRFHCTEEVWGICLKFRMRFVKCMAGGICGDIRVRYLCAVWEPGKITPLLLCICICNICIVFVET